MRLLEGGKQVIVVRFLVHNVNRLHLRGERRGHGERQLLPARRLLGRSGFLARGRHPLTGRIALMGGRVVVDEWIDRQINALR